jgi:ATP-dependent Clp protease ATP-binding subunit ClpB
LTLPLLDAAGADGAAIGAETRNALVALPRATGAGVAKPQAARALLDVIDRAGRTA